MVKINININNLKASGVCKDQIPDPWRFDPKMLEENRVLEGQNLSQICLFMELIEGKFLL